MAEYKILVADDDHDITEMVAARLKREGYDVSMAFDGEEALKMVDSQQPSIVLLDLLMPKFNGFEVLGAIRKKYPHKWIPVIIISAQADLDSVRESYNLEADHYLRKPCSMEMILTGIRTMISLMPLRIIK
jgi:two-component system response regulator VicR